ncbi:MAG: hypothetical protein QM479_16055, partial [Pseudomonadota bacterium]
SDAKRILIADMQCHDGTSVVTKHIAKKPYISWPGDTIANQPYIDVIKSVPGITSSIDSDTVLGDFVLKNDGKLNDFLNYAWHGHKLNFALGDKSWSRDDFIPVSTGINAGFKSIDRFSLSFYLRDKRKLLETPVETQLIDDKWSPLVLGKCKNVTPVLVDSVTRLYCINHIACTIDEVRDNGNSVAFTDNGDGTFNTTNPVYGDITGDVSEPHNTISLFVDYLCNLAGLIPAEIDSSYPNTATVGMVIQSGVSINQVLTDLLTSAGGYGRFNRVGIYKLNRFDVPVSGGDILSGGQIKPNTIKLVKVEQPYKSRQLSYQKNWTIQNKSSLATVLSDADKELYSSEYKRVSAINATLDDERYPLAETPEIKESYFYYAVDAQAEVDRLIILRATERRQYSVETFATTFAHQVADSIFMHNTKSSFFATGKDVTIISLTENYDKNQNAVRVWL